ncbi:hypothetical protein R1sor_024023 [Riccia sorocarpa]|uniref:CCHC-type domain-containing protein n=1 Tax=Riccia sorocarpa TaxID=122646 RepID=A0ABD3GSC1_9MARC
MADPDMVYAERHFLMESTRQIQQRIQEFNRVVDPSVRISDVNNTSWIQNSAPTRVVHTQQHTAERSHENSRSHQAPGAASLQAGSASSSRVGQHPGISPASVTRGISQPAGEGVGNSDPAAASTYGKPQNLLVNEWPSLNSQGAAPKANTVNASSAGKNLPRVEEVESAEIEEILDGLISNSLPVENIEGVKEEDIVEIDPGFLVSSTRYLKENSVVIYTMDLKVSFKYVENWADIVFRQTLGVKINGICSLSHNCYQVIFESSQGRNHVFANAPSYMGEAMVYTLPWDPRFNPRELRTRSVPIWGELPDVPPNCVPYGLALMATLGVLLYATKNVETQHSNLLKGCVLMDISRPLKDEKFFRVPGFRDKLIRQKIRYSGFPDACFECKRRGHIALNCPEKLNQGGTQVAAENKEGSGEQQAKAAARPVPKPKTDTYPRRATSGKKDKEEKQEFQTVRRKGWRPFKDPQFRPPSTVDNRFGVLQVEEEDPETDETWGQRFEGADEDHEMEGAQEDTTEPRKPVCREEENPSNDQLGGGAVPGGKETETQEKTHEGEGEDHDCPMIPEGDENFGSFEEAEWSNARIASVRGVDATNRLSCASCNRLDFAEGRKKTKPDEEVGKSSGATAAKKNEKTGTTNGASGSKPART